MAAAVEKKKPVWGTVAGVRPDTSGHNLKVKVVEAKLVLERAARPGNKPQRIAECVVGDQSGVILFTARNEQVDLMKPGQYVTLRNAKVDMFRGSMRLAVNQWGKLESAADDGLDFEPQADFNLSLVEYELVPVPTPAPAEQPAVAEEAPAVEEKGPAEEGAAVAAAETEAAADPAPEVQPEEPVPA